MVSRTTSPEEQNASKRSPWRRFLFIGGVLLLVVVLAATSIPLLTPKGWSKDVVFDDGQMNMRVQFKAEFDSLTAGTVALMAKVKRDEGFPMRVAHVHFTISKNGRMVRAALEGDPVGDFSAMGQGFYMTVAELPAPGSYQVDLLVEHEQSSFTSSWPLEVKQ